MPGHELPECHVYRTLDDLDGIRAAALRAAEAGRTGTGVVIGGGLLGLEAANALNQFGLRTHVVEMMPRLMAQQVDEGGGVLLSRMIGDLGLAVHVGVGTESIESLKDSDVRLRLSDGEVIDAGVVIFAAGIRPRDELAKAAGLQLAERGGVRTDLSCQTSDPGGTAEFGEADWCRCRSIRSVSHPQARSRSRGRRHDSLADVADEVALHRRADGVDELVDRHRMDWLGAYSVAQNAQPDEL